MEVDLIAQHSGWERFCIPGAQDKDPGLADSQENLERLVHLAVGDFGHRPAEGFEVLGLGLVHQDFRWR
jgi:hypothetical protein